jgi:hypothetical protein
MCVCLCAENRGNVRNLDLLNCTSRLRRTQPHAAATYRQIHDASTAANSGNDKESSYKMCVLAERSEDFVLLFLIIFGGLLRVILNDSHSALGAI